MTGIFRKALQRLFNINSLVLGSVIILIFFIMLLHHKFL